MKIATIIALIALAARAAWAAPQELSAYLDQELSKTDMAAEQRAAVVGAVRAKFGNFAVDPVAGVKLDGAKTVLSIISDSCKGQSPARMAEVSFAAYRAVLRGADQAVADAAAAKICQTDTPSSSLASWLNGYADMRSGKVPAYIAEELVLVAMEKGWPVRTFDAVKWGLVEGVKEGFSPKNYAGFVLDAMVKDPSAPGRTVADAKVLFRKAKGTETAYVFRKAPPEPAAASPKPEVAVQPQAPPPQAQAATEPETKPENAEKVAATVPLQSAPEPSALFVETFKSGYENTWDPSSVAGGNYDRFAKVSGALIVSVPEGNTWGKTGVVSKTPFITIQEGKDAAPQKIEFVFDENDTTGFVIALSKDKAADVWWASNVWLHWSRRSVTAGAFEFLNSQNSSESYGSTPTPAKAPAKVTLLIKPGSVRFESSQGASKEGSFSWLKSGASAYLYIFSHPPTEGAAASFTLKSIKVY